MRIALVTCRHPGEHDHDFDFLAPALRRRGAEAEKAIWDDEAVDWSAFDLALINSTWDYHERPDDFRSWLARAEGETRLVNPRKVVDWNLDKRYLRELEAAGTPVIPSVWTEPGSEEAALAAIDDAGWQELVIKPVVDLGAANLVRVERELAPRILDAVTTPAIAQPFLPSLEREGELSVVIAAGEVAHALRKRPAAGDFRVQPEYGGTHEAIDKGGRPAEIALGAVEAAARLAGAEPLYARADLVHGDDGELLLIELELIEPAFYLDVEPRSAELLARALLAAAA